ncbi:MAG TPA: NADH-quinone oxidoreductase subunit NuoG [Candidatus Acidoferrales bacterium]|nr:NADH-quinone oxidoreductase subunit NuoG [Candidatus Acidoferrales bacterium]
MVEQKIITFTLNERKMTVPAGTLVIEAARRLGIEVPSFCYYPGLSLQAACRMCLVEVEKAPKMQTACTLVATEGMVVRTDTPQVHKARKDMLEFLLTNHPLDCPVCDKGGECELQDMTFRYGLDKSRFVEEKLHTPEEQWSPVVYYDAPRCILCFRCVRVCDEGMDVKALGVGQRGVNSVIIPNGEDHLECEECGMCIDICPVGALTSGAYRYKTRPWEMSYVPTVCAHCSNGCKTTLSVRNNAILRGNNRDLSGINKDFLCIKGRYGFDFTSHKDRLRVPLVRRGGELKPSSWEDALAEVAARLKAVRDAHGPDAIGFIGSNRTSNEEHYLLGRLARASIGTNNVDHHRTVDYAALMQALGERAGAAQATMEQLYAANAILLIGNNPTDQNPLVAWQIRTAIRHHGARLYVINAEEIKMHRQAAKFVRVASGAESVIAQWLATREGDLELETSLEMMELKGALEKENDVVIVFGAELRGAALAHLVKFGSSLRGETRYMALGDYANSRGAADMGLLPDRLPGYASVSDATAREAFGKLWGATLPETPGLEARQMLAAAAEGKLKTLYVVGANPFKTFGTGTRPAGLELLVVHEMFLTETARDADIVLPAACAYEKSGTVTNTSGEVQLLRKAMETMGTRTDFDILRIVSHQLARAGVGLAINLRTPEAALEEIRRNVRGYDVSLPGLLSGGAERTAPAVAANGYKLGDVSAENIFSARDTLFTSGTLGRYCSMIQAVPEAKSKP